MPCLPNVPSRLGLLALENRSSSYGHLTRVARCRAVAWLDCIGSSRSRNGRRGQRNPGGFVSRRPRGPAATRRPPGLRGLVERAKVAGGDPAPGPVWMHVTRPPVGEVPHVMIQRVEHVAEHHAPVVSRQARNHRLEVVDHCRPRRTRAACASGRSLRLPTWPLSRNSPVPVPVRPESWSSPLPTDAFRSARLQTGPCGWPRWRSRQPRRGHKCGRRPRRRFNRPVAAVAARLRLPSPAQPARKSLSP